MAWKNDIRIVVSIDFGTTYTGFAYAHRQNPELITNDTWPDVSGPIKTNTVILYDANFKKVKAWGLPALAPRSGKRQTYFDYRPVERFKLFLGNLPDSEKPKLPENLDYKKVIADYLKEIEEGTSFLVVDCGGGTVDLTTRKLLPGNQLGEITERTGDFCGSTFIDNAFIKFMKFRVGESAMDLLENQRYSNLQYMIHEFFRRVKFSFTGDEEDFKVIEFDIDDVCPALKQYITGKEKEILEEDDWIIELTFEDVKAMFDPVIKKIINLISRQLIVGGACTAMFLVGGFSESKYLQSRIKSTFNYIKNISVPKQPQAAIVRGALQYGLRMDVIKTRVLKYTYGIEIEGLFNEAIDPEYLKVDGHYIYKFYRLAERGRQVGVDESFSNIFRPLENTTKLRFSLYISNNLNETYCEGLEKLGELTIDMPDTHLGKERPVEFRLMFGRMEITATARNQVTGQEHNASFKLEF
ncbi:23893_t:CDS:2 [Dentiscutata erythropus]|uniref:23893_t:CDS:1 n=1 Tax=Dentiscutata erythropus TaxID=1348616 RepID=A0A9N9EYX2_9GLOM|nr:23893_t:CDS:2 [Dentiscutata erythropus]